MSKHTPAPWLYRGKSDSVHEACATHPYGRQIFQFRGEDEDLPCDPNLALILAAPDLLEALEYMLNCQYDYDPRRQSDCDMCAKARAAIAKARGES